MNTVKERSVPFGILLIGSLLLIISAVYENYVLSFIGLSIAFWGVLYLYIAIKHAPIDFLNAAVISGLENNERVLNNNSSASIGLYLPPRYLRGYSNALVFVPLSSQLLIPKIEMINEDSLFTKDHSGLLLIPPGFAFSKLMEAQLGYQFTRFTLDEFIERLPRLLVEKMGIAEQVEVSNEGSLLRIILTKNMFKDLCIKMDSLPVTHSILGCTLSSAIACALSKATGHLVMINSDKQSAKKTIIEYKIIKDQS